MSLTRLRPEFQEEGEPGSSSSPRAYIQKESAVFWQVIPGSRGKLGILLSPRAYMAEIVRTMRLRTVLRGQAVFERRGETGIFLCPRVIEG